MSKNIIFHIPWKIKEGRLSSTGIRPVEMLQAFKDIGYNVDIVMGDIAERKNQIKQIKNHIREGKKYSFVYSESSTVPTSIASGLKNILSAWNLDMNFLAYCKQNAIPIGLFYRDLYWKFKNHIKRLEWYKKPIFLLLYKYDLFRYAKILDVFFVPSMGMKDYLPELEGVIFKELPPGCGKDKKNDLKADECISICYVGGLGYYYRMHKLFAVVSKSDKMKLLFSTREAEWNEYKAEYGNYVNENISIFHLNGDKLDEIYDRSIIASNWVQADEYYQITIQVKVFEYISQGLPVITTSNTVVGDFIENNNLGWAIPYDEKDFIDLINEIKKDPGLIDEKRASIKEYVSNNHWSNRASYVGSLMEGYKK